MTSTLIVNAFLSLEVLTAIVLAVAWAIRTQHRDLPQSGHPQRSRGPATATTLQMVPAARRSAHGPRVAQRRSSQMQTALVSAGTESQPD